MAVPGDLSETVRFYGLTENSLVTCDFLPKHLKGTMERHGMTEQNEANAMNSESSISALVRPDLLGFSFHLAWLCLFIYNVVPGFAGRSDHNIEFGVFNPVYFYSMVSLVVVLGYGIAMTKNFMHLAR